jgi:hypothetical protein
MHGKLLNRYPDRYFSITNEEAQEAWGSNYKEYYEDPKRGYVAG